MYTGSSVNKPIQKLDLNPASYFDGRCCNNEIVNSVSQHSWNIGLFINEDIDVVYKTIANLMA